MRFAIPWPKVLLVANVVLVLALVLFSVDWYVRWRIGQFLNAYHVQVIVPMTSPRPAPSVSSK
jgi:hypothetical protein